MADDEENDPTAPFNELEAFDSLWQALKWRQIKKRLPICFKKTLQNRYFFANLLYLCYAIGILLIDFHPAINGGGGFGDSCNCEVETIDGNSTDGNSTEEEWDSTIVNRVYVGFAVIHLVSATLYWWAWKDHRWNDVIMIPEYLNHIEAGLYLWSAIWYSRESEEGFTYKVHIIETTAAFVELFASFGWIMSWYRTYTRTISRGYTFDDPDTIAYILTTLSSFVYITYNIQVITDESQYETNKIYYIGDIMYSIGAFFYLWANLRDDGWLWWLPVGGQYGIAAGRMQTGKPVKVGLPHLLIGGDLSCTCCRQRQKNDVNTTRPFNVIFEDEKHYTNNDIKNNEKQYIENNMINDENYF